MQEEMQMAALFYSFSPLFLLQLVVGLPAAAVLLSLVFKTRTELTNTNVYLASLSVSSLLQLFTAVPLLVTLIARQWILGNSACSLTAGIVAGVPMVSLCCHLLIVRDKYKATKNPSQWEWMKSSRAYVNVVCVWIASLVFAVLIVGMNFEETNRIEEKNETDFSCFMYDRYPAGFSKLVVRGLAVFFTSVVQNILIIVTVTYHILLHKELVHISRRRNPTVTTGAPDTAPASTSTLCLLISGFGAEHRTAKSLLLIFVVQALSTIAGILFDVIDLIVDGSQSFRGPRIVHFMGLLVVLVLFYIPTLAPAILIVSSSRYRQRVIRLLQGRFTAENVEGGKLLIKRTPVPIRQRGAHNIQHQGVPKHMLYIKDKTQDTDQPNDMDGIVITATHLREVSLTPPPNLTPTPQPPPLPPISKLGEIELPNMVPY